MNAVYRIPTDALRRRLRRVLKWVGVSELIGLLAVAVLVSFCLDYLLELPWVVRAVFLGALIFLYVRRFLRARERLQYRVPARDLLQTVENQYPSLEGHLMNASEFQGDLRDEAGHRDILERYLLLRASKESQAALERVRPYDVFHLGPLFARLGVAAIAALTLLIAVALLPGDFAIWANRNLLLSTAAWPRDTHFALERSEEVWRHPRGDSIEIRGWVLGSIPRHVTIHIHSRGEDRSSRILPGIKREGHWPISSAVTTGAPGAGEAVEARELYYKLPTAMESFEFYFEGGDNRSETVLVEVRDRPQIRSTRFTLSPPPHTGKDLESFDNPGGEITAVAGTRVTVEATTTQRLVDAWIRLGEDSREMVTDASDQTFRHTFTLEKSTFLELGARAGDWELDTKTLQFPLVAYPDRTPFVRLEIEGENRLITPTGAIGYRVEAEDDFGFSRVQLRVRARDRSAKTADATSAPGAAPSGGEAGDPAEEPVQPVQPVQATAPRGPPDGATILENGVEETIVDLAPWSVEATEDGVQLAPIGSRLELAPLQLEAGMQLVLQAATVDNDEPGGFKTGLSTVETFQVVDADELREEMDRIRIEAQSKLEELAYVEREVLDALEEREFDVSEEDRQGQQHENQNQFQGQQQIQGQQQNQGAQQQGTQQQNQQPGQQQQNQNQQTGQQQDQGQQQNQGAQQQGSPRQNQQPGQQEQNQSQQPGQQQNQQNQGAQQQNRGTPQQNQGSEQQQGSQQQQQNQSSRQQPSFDDLSARQRQVRRELDQLRDRLREMTRALEDNNLIEEEEKRRFEDEIDRPLEEVAEDRLPRSADDLEQIGRPETPEEDRSQARRDVERIADELEQVAQELGKSKSFKELLQRIQGVIELQEKATEETGKSLRRSF